MKITSSLEKDFINNYPTVVANILSKQDVSTTSEYLDNVPDNMLVQITENFKIQYLSQCIKFLNENAVSIIINSLKLQEKVNLFRLLDSKIRNKLYEKFPNDAPQIKSHLKAIPNSALDLISRGIFTLPIEVSAKDAQESLKKTKLSINKYIYVLNEEGKLSGVTTLRKIINSKPQTPVSILLNNSMDYIYSNSSIWEIETLEQWKKYHIIPVVEDNMAFLGVIKLEDLFKLKASLIKKQEQSLSPMMSMLEVTTLGMLSITNSFFSKNKRNT